MKKIRKIKNLDSFQKIKSSRKIKNKTNLNKRKEEFLGFLTRRNRRIKVNSMISQSIKRKHLSSIQSLRKTTQLVQSMLPKYLNIIDLVINVINHLKL